jgi:hypothetical protein
MADVVCIPDTFARTITDLHGAAGLEWLGSLPTLVEEYARQWSLIVLPPFGTLSYHYVAPAVRADGTEVVPKAGFPSPELCREIDALCFYAGRGSAQLFEANREQGVFVLERLKPGAPLSNEDDDSRATAVAAEVMPQLHRRSAFCLKMPPARNIIRNSSTAPTPGSIVDTGAELAGRHFARTPERLTIDCNTVAQPSTKLPDSAARA